MSVPKNKRSHGELEVLTRARELKTHTLGICTNTNNFPKRYRWCITTITERLSELGLELNTKKTGIQPLKHGIKFLGFKFILTDTGKVVMKLISNKASKERHKLKSYLSM